MTLTSRHSPDAAPPEETIPVSVPEALAPAMRGEPVIPSVQTRLLQDKVLRVMAPIVAGLIAAPSIVWWIGQAVAFLKDPGGFDFCIYFAAALALRDNPHANIFDLHIIQAAARAHQAVVPVGPYLYPPLLAIAIEPLTRLPYVEAARIWAGLNLALWVLATVLLASVLAWALARVWPAPPRRTPATAQRHATGWPRRVLDTWRRPSEIAVLAAGVAVFASMSHEPTAKGVALGQVSTLIYLLLVLAPWLLIKRMPELAGAALALATLIKLLPVVLIAYFLLRGRWRLIAGAIACSLLAFGVMVHAIGMQAVLASRSILWVGGQYSLAANNHALEHVPIWIAVELGRQPGPKTERLGYILIVAVALIFAAGMLLAGWSTLQRRMSAASRAKPDPAHDLIGYAWAICTMLLVSPIVWEHYGSWLLPAFALCLGEAVRLLVRAQDDPETRARTAPAVFAVCAVIVAYSVTSRLFPFGYDTESSFIPGPYVLHIAIRPFFMVLRPLGTTLAWSACGWLFLRPYFPLGWVPRAEPRMRTDESQRPAEGVGA